jgi:CO/xanthine dehydrogenase FAD-binding subunit
VAVRLTEAERGLLGTTCGADAIERAAACCATLEALDDMHGQARYRRSIAAAVVRSAVAAAYAGAR